MQVIVHAEVDGEERIMREWIRSWPRRTRLFKREQIRQQPGGGSLYHSDDISKVKAMWCGVGRGCEGRPPGREAPLHGHSQVDSH